MRPRELTDACLIPVSFKRNGWQMGYINYITLKKLKCLIHFLNEWCKLEIEKQNKSEICEKSKNHIKYDKNQSLTIQKDILVTLFESQSFSVNIRR